MASSLSSSSSSSFAFGFDDPKKKDIETEILNQHSPSSEFTLLPNQWPAPLVIEPGISSLIWPLSTEKFLSTYYTKHPIASHVTDLQRRVNRLQRLQKEMHDFDIPSLIKEAIRVVVWMKDLRTGRMNYVDLPPDPQIALACYHSGHSLYFNPPIEFQRRYISAICDDLGMSFGATMDGGFGGDVEIFAVKGTHTTPRHFDAQENFTIQLIGSKKWNISQQPEIIHPTTNLHPDSTNRTAFFADTRTLQASGHTKKEGFNLCNIKSFELLPGSTLYLPAGCSHEVLCEDINGSLSINFSISGVRWADFIAKRIMQTMLHDSDARGRIHLLNGNLTDTRLHLQQILNRLTKSLTMDHEPNTTSCISSKRSTTIADLWLPDGILGDNNRRIALYECESSEFLEIGDIGVIVKTLSTIHSSGERMSENRKRKHLFMKSTTSKSKRIHDDGDVIVEDEDNIENEKEEVDAESFLTNELREALFESTKAGNVVKMTRNPITILTIISEKDLPERLRQCDRGLCRLFSGIGSLINSDSHQQAIPDYSVWISYPRSIIQKDLEKLYKLSSQSQSQVDSKEKLSDIENSGTINFESYTFGKNETLDVLIQIFLHFGFVRLD
jgi:hypothetical protein